MSEARQTLVADKNASMQENLVLTMHEEDLLLIGQMRVEIVETRGARVVCRVSAPGQPCVLMSKEGRVKVGKHHKLIDHIPSE